MLKCTDMLPFGQYLCIVVYHLRKIIKPRSFIHFYKTKEFYTYIGSVCSEPTDGSVIENLLKNIGNTGSFSFPNQKCR